MQRPRSSHTNSDPSRSSVPGSAAATSPILRSAKVISLHAVRTVLRPQAPGRRMMQATIVEEVRERTLQGFFLQDEPLLRFRDFDAGR
jgi:hypothetical protein